MEKGSWRIRPGLDFPGKEILGELRREGSELSFPGMSILEDQESSEGKIQDGIFLEKGSWTGQGWIFLGNHPGGSGELRREDSVLIYPGKGILDRPGLDFPGKEILGELRKEDSELDFPGKGILDRPGLDFPGK
ncbi:hypothetical protein HGM15179_020653 [Zosterops borbonicus]|uniref:Uncharacterized protein n=1 Tax=Zosterops borbonicus TaxID=364589 RepID=A0A8K1D6I9_9PASS|nr:hypothetical protein HGM15179_020653 [Zosterops borbonicus]